MKCVLSGITGLSNRGVEALVRPVVDRIVTDFRSEAVVLTKTPAYDAHRISRQGVGFVMDGLSCAGPNVLRWARERVSTLWGRMAPDYRRCKSVLASSTVLIASGGDVFSSDYGGLFRHLRPLQIGLKLNIPVIFLAHSIGPFKTEEEAEAWTRVAREATLITVREPASYQYLTEDLGLPEDCVHQTADVAFLLKACAPPSTASWRDAYGITGDRPLVAIAPSQGIASYAHVDADVHLDAWVRTTEMLVQDMGAEVIIIPHVQQSLPNNDDRIIATALLKRLRHPERVTLAGWDHSAAEFKGIISESELVVAERMHACIAGLGSSVPTVAVGYSVKADGVMRSLFGEAVDKLGVLVDVERFLDPAHTRACVENAWKNRRSIQGILAGQQDSLCDAAERNFVLLNEALCRRGISVDMEPCRPHNKTIALSGTASAPR